jgi:hypothetical protein
LTVVVPALLVITKVCWLGCWNAKQVCPPLATVKLNVGFCGSGSVRAGLNVTTWPVVKVHVCPSGLSVPLADAAGRHETAALAVTFQQLSLPSQPQSSEPPPLLPDPAPPHATTSTATVPAITEARTLGITHP